MLNLPCLAAMPSRTLLLQAGCLLNQKHCCRVQVLLLGGKSALLSDAISTQQAYYYWPMLFWVNC